jgi:hypothetical protein
MTPLVVCPRQDFYQSRQIKKEADKTAPQEQITKENF